jgi:DHA2 family multidrug resistance protein-like MFS transporter
MSRWVAAAGALLVSLDSMMNIAFPAIAAAFAVPPERVRWVIICYVLTYAITSLAGGAVGDRIGHVAVFRAGLALSVLAFVMGGAAGSFDWLLVARVAQGFAGGLIYGTAPALAVAGAPPEVRGRRLGFLSGAMGLGFLGSLPAGVLVESVGWRYVFHVRVPLALIVLVWAVVTRAGPVEREQKPLGLGDVTLGPVLRAGALSFVARGAIFAIWLLVPFYLVDARGLGALVGGIFFMLTPLGTAIAAPLAGRLSDRIGASAPAVVGLALEAAGLGVLGFVDGTTPIALVALALFVAGFGLGFFEVPNMATIMAAFPSGRQGAAGGLSFLARTLGVVAGVAVMGQIVAARSAAVGFLGAFAESLLVAALSVAAACVFALADARARR